jgi:lipopolysaccharide/colanic/teichoic acid biosynthesis glycosyltransferase
LPRWFEVAVATLGLIVGAPLLVAVAVAVRLSSPGPVLFRQERVGRGGRLFTMYKFRTMVVNGGGPHVTASGDPRVTGVGRWLRRLKLDELPELVNVLRGDMSLVGPRPEVPRYVDLADPCWQVVLQVRPGITDPVTVRLRHEEELLAAQGGDPEVYYRQVLQPAKLRGYVEYLEGRTWRKDLGVLVQTALAVVTPPRRGARACEPVRASSPNGG